MKEIDFLPEWYKNSRRRQINFHTQYIVLGGIFVVMMVWNFVATGSISKAEAELSRQASAQAKAEDVSIEFDEIKGRIAELQKKTAVMEEIDSRIDVAGVLAEISFLIGEKIALSKVEFKAERFADPQAGRSNSGSPLLIAGQSAAGRGGDKSLLFGGVRFRVEISGVASDAGDVADLVCRLEDSPYFCLVYPSFSRSRNIKEQGSAAENYQVSEFEINCYLSNYRQ